jgi:TonB-like protein
MEKTNMQRTMRNRAAHILLAMGLTLGVPSLHAQENRKLISNPTPAYPEMARRFRLSGVVKVQVLIAPDGQIKDVSHRRPPVAGDCRPRRAEELEVCAS